MAHRPMFDNSVNGVRSRQNLSCNWTGSADFGRLVPIHWEELLQGDHVITCKPRIEMQCLPLASPTFGKIDLYCHYFIVPLRQLWSNFYDFWSRVGGAKDDLFPYATPKQFATWYNSGMPHDSDKRAAYKHWTSLGLNPFFTLSASNVTDVSTPIWLAPFRAYAKIWYDFYRDPELISDESADQYLDTSGFENQGITEQDYAYRFLMPHVRSIKNCWVSDLFATDGHLAEWGDLSHPNVFDYHSKLPYANSAGDDFTNPAAGTSNAVLSLDYDIEVANSTPQSSAQLRLLEALNRLSERLSLSGKRQIEALYARYGVKPNWSQMNLARYVGGGKSTVFVDNIISSADTVGQEGGSPLGAKAGTGYCALQDVDIEVSVDEPSILMGIVSVMPHIHFVQGLSKKWQRSDLTTFFQDSLQYVGQIAVAKREVAKSYRNVNDYDQSKDSQTFAFCDPYYEYKMGLDTLAGDFMKYHNVELPQDEQAKKDILYMQSMEQYIDFPSNRNFNMDNFLVDGDQFNKIFSYLGGSIWDDVDDHFHLCIDKEVIVERPMEGYAIPTLETTADPHKKTQKLSSDKML